MNDVEEIPCLNILVDNLYFLFPLLEGWQENEGARVYNIYSAGC